MRNNNDKWGALSIKDRASLMDMYLKSGIKELSEMKKHYNGVPYRDLNTSDYDYFNASPEMIPTEKGQHWNSRNPHTGQILKSENHPTFDLAVEAEKNAGYKIVRGYDGNLYSIPNQPDNYVEKSNILDGTEDEQTLSGKPVSTIKQTTRKVKSAIMDVLQKYQYESFIDSIKDTLNDLELGRGSKKDYENNKYEDVAQDSFLFSKKEQKDAFLNSGYIEGTPGDYGLVAKAVGNRDLPVYQSGTDDITRDKLTVIGNLSDMFFGEGELTHAGSFPTALYKDAEGNVYQKAWDLQDYGSDSTGSGGFYSYYDKVKQLGARMLDKLGNPIVRTTGFRKISDDMLYSLMNQVKDSKLWSELINTRASNVGNEVMENRILTAYDDYLFVKAQDLAEKENREFSMEDYNTMKSSIPLDVFKADITKYYDPKILNEFYGIFIY